MKSIRDHVDPEDKRKLSELESKFKQNKTDPLKSKQNKSFWLKKTSESKGSILDPLKRNEGNTIYISESGLYSLILRSKLESARAFKQWVTKVHKYRDSLTFKIESETDLQCEVVSLLKKRFQHSIFTATVGENQDTINKRIESHKKGYLRGSPDLIVNNLHKHYTGFAIELKNPNSKGILSYDQSKMLRQYPDNGFETCYDHIIKQLIEYFRDVRIKCSYCSRNLSALCQLKTI